MYILSLLRRGGAFQCTNCCAQIALNFLPLVTNLFSPKHIANDIHCLSFYDDGPTCQRCHVLVLLEIGVQGLNYYGFLTKQPKIISKVKPKNITSLSIFIQLPPNS